MVFDNDNVKLMFLEHVQAMKTTSDKLNLVASHSEPRAKVVPLLTIIDEEYVFVVFLFVEHE